MRIAATLSKCVFMHSKSLLVPKTHCRSICFSSVVSNSSTEVKPQVSQPQSQFFKLPPRGERKKQKFDYFLVVDFEATCDAPVNVVPQEIIEFPVLKINAKTFESESMFHSYVQPKVHKELTSFCTELTGIIQEMIVEQPPFEKVFADFQEWLDQEGLLKPDVKFTFVTCGDWDLRYMFQIQCKCSRIQIPSYMKTWINIKLCFCELAQTYPRNLVTMLKYCGLQHVGKLHSGIDDCKNIAQILKDLADRGMVYEVNGCSN